ncbi:MAG TPA: type IV pilin protein [Janthinobacterium sp.]|jgi:type IV pilus assembly protein PilE|nr:type IV pilin protein [Janthinobacterium sp.]
MKRGAGFTLIELMIVLTIIGILAAMVYPSFHRYVVRSKRVQAQGLLLQLMQQQERYFSQNNRYLAFSAASSDPLQPFFKWWSGNSASDSAYEMGGAACPDQPITECVELSATPGTDKVDKHFRDDDCGVLTMNSVGRRAASGRAEHCWP